jgi:hypothetical protein
MVDFETYAAHAIEKYRLSISISAVVRPSRVVARLWMKATIRTVIDSRILMNNCLGVKAEFLKHKGTEFPEKSQEFYRSRREMRFL